MAVGHSRRATIGRRKFKFLIGFWVVVALVSATPMGAALGIFAAFGVMILVLPLAMVLDDHRLAAAIVGGCLFVITLVPAARGLMALRTADADRARGYFVTPVCVAGLVVSSMLAMWHLERQWPM